MKRYLAVSLLLTACGSSATPGPAATQFIQPDGRITYALTATLDVGGITHPAQLSLDRPVSVTMPKTISTLANASFTGRATLTVGTQFCDYQSDQNGVYVRQDGACNSFTPEAPISLKVGDSMSLSLQGCPNSPVSVEALVTGEAL